MKPDIITAVADSNPSTLMNPTLNPAVVQRAVEEDPVAANVEYCTSPGLFREDVETFIARAAVDALVVPGRKELPPRKGVAYAAFADLSGGRHDDAGLAIGHKENGVIVLDVPERFKAPHDPHDVVARMVAILRRYGIDRAIGDAYAAEWVKTAFAQHGIRYERCTTSVWHEGAQVKNKVAKPKAVLYAELLPRLTSGEVELLDDETLIVQLSSLQRRTRSGARDSIDHPPGGGGKDDLANCLAGVCDAVSQRRIVAGAVSSDSGEAALVGGKRGFIRLGRDRDRRLAHERRIEQRYEGVTHEQETLLEAIKEQLGPSARHRHRGIGRARGPRQYPMTFFPDD